jgi:acyl-CoA hydrolase
MDAYDEDDEQHKILRMTVLATPEMANFSGHVHGGALLRLLDQVAYACASRYAHHYAVTRSVDQVVFREPVNVGELLTFLACVNYTGRTSMEIGVRVIAETVIRGSSRHVMTCYFSMVAVDEDGHPAAVPPVQIRDEVEQRRHDAAVARRELRKEIERRALQIRQNPQRTG